MLRKKLVLIVEDDPIIAMGLAASVEELDGRLVGSFATVAEALSVLRHERVEAVLIDVNLEDRDITPVASKLAEIAIPFLLHTGTGPPSALVEALPRLSLVMKPARSKLVVAKLAEQLFGLNGTDAIRMTASGPDRDVCTFH